MTDKTAEKSKKTISKTKTADKLSSKEKKMAKAITQLEEKIQELESELLDQQQRVEAAEEKMLRVVAEYENGKKRLEREKERSLAFAKDKVFVGLFPIIDNLERSARFDSDEDSDSQKQGTRLVLEQIKKYMMDTNGIEAFDPLGEDFDPDIHEAMAMRESEAYDSGKIIEVFEKGYREGDRILRPAKVIVSQ
ncbi:MAG: nucleotide exchange factor GrpE [Candidatus Marinimicrobia bacterium]|nr:nucleotide exchange factor GrpE [Candidatus Neomarinimicrobiota bacterium]